MRRIPKVKALPGYRLELELDDGLAGTVDLSEAVSTGGRVCAVAQCESLTRPQSFYERCSTDRSKPPSWFVAGGGDQAGEWGKVAGGPA